MVDMALLKKIYHPFIVFPSSYLHIANINELHVYFSVIHVIVQTLIEDNENSILTIFKRLVYSINVIYKWSSLAFITYNLLLLLSFHSCFELLYFCILIYQSRQMLRIYLTVCNINHFDLYYTTCVVPGSNNFLGRGRST